jgi:hypothetical protein
MQNKQARNRKVEVPAVTELLDTAAAATVVGVAPQTLTKWRCEGSGPPYFKVGSLVRYDRGAVERWRDARIVVPGNVA